MVFEDALAEMRNDDNVKMRLPSWDYLSIAYIRMNADGQLVFARHYFEEDLDDAWIAVDEEQPLDDLSAVDVASDQWECYE